MSNTFPLLQISQPGNPDSNLILWQYKHDLMATFMEIKSVNPKLKQTEIGKNLGCWTSKVQRYWKDINLFSPYRVPPISIKENKRLQIVNMTSKDLKRPQLTSK